MGLDDDTNWMGRGRECSDRNDNYIPGVGCDVFGKRCLTTAMMNETDPGKVALVGWETIHHNYKPALKLILYASPNIVSKSVLGVMEPRQLH